VVDSISKNYRYVIIDNEAGLEHLSRRTTRDVQALLIVSDPSHRGLVTAERVAGFQKELDIRIEKVYLILNGLRDETIPAPLQEQIDRLDIPLLGTVPYDETLRDYEVNGRALVGLDSQTPAYRAVAEMMKKVV
jgi:CO dehydrogenase maturation factor